MSDNIDNTIDDNNSMDMDVIFDGIEESESTTFDIGQTLETINGEVEILDRGIEEDTGRIVYDYKYKDIDHQPELLVYQDAVGDMLLD